MLDVYTDRPALGCECGGIYWAIDVDLLRHYFANPIPDFPGFDSDEWRPFREIARFSREQSLAAAAATLRAVAPMTRDLLPTRTRSPFPDRGGGQFGYLLSRWPWPISGLIFSAAGYEDVAARADRLERGEFGTPDEWLEWEAGWQEEPFSLAEAIADFNPDDPFARGDSRSPSPLAANGWMYPVPAATDAVVPVRAFAARALTMSPLGRAYAAHIGTFGIVFATHIETDLSTSEVAALLESPDFPNADLVDALSLNRWLARCQGPSEGDPRAIMEAFNELSRFLPLLGRPPRMGRSVRPMQPLVSVALEVLREDPENTSALKALVLGAASRADVVGVRAHEARPSDPEGRLAAALLYVRGNPGRIQTDGRLRHVAKALVDSPHLHELVAELLTRPDAPREGSIQFALSVLDEIADQARPQLVRALLDAIGELVGRRTSELGQPERWISLGLGAPIPAFRSE